MKNLCDDDLKWFSDNRDTCLENQWSMVIWSILVFGKLKQNCCSLATIIKIKTVFLLLYINT